MSREARILIDNKDCWYFIHAQTAKNMVKGALLKNGGGESLFSTIETYAKAYCFDVASIFISKNEYSLVIKIPKFQILSQEVLLKKAEILYGHTLLRYDLWNKKKWKAFNKSLFSIAFFMRAVNHIYVNWQKLNVKSKHKFAWNDRFRSCILANEEAVLDAMLYLESGPIRDKLASNLLSYPNSSFYLREKLKADWLIKPEGNLGLPKGQKGQDLYIQKLKHRANLPVKTGETIQNEIANGYAKGCNLKKQITFITGVIMGTEKEVQPWLAKSLNVRKNVWKDYPMKLSVGTQYVLVGRPSQV